MKALSIFGLFLSPIPLVIFFITMETNPRINFDDKFFIKLDDGIIIEEVVEGGDIDSMCYDCIKQSDMQFAFGDGFYLSLLVFMCFFSIVLLLLSISGLILSNSYKKTLNEKNQLLLEKSIREEITKEEDNL